MIVMDLEWNRGYDTKPIDEILQIGAVRTDESGAIRDTFSVYIKPRIHKKFDRGAKSLPELSESLQSDVTFPEAWGMFEAWRQGDSEYAFWGTGDFDAVRKNCEYYGISCAEPARLFDFQSAFSHVLGQDGQQAALWRVTEYLGIPDSFTFHNALNDAMYTALVGAWLGEDCRYIKPPAELGRRRHARLCTEAFTPKRGKKLGPFDHYMDALNLRAARTASCPICGELMWVRQWHTVDELRFFGTLVCDDHGKFIARLTFDPASRTVRTALPELSRELVWEYASVSRKGETIPCKASGRRRRGRGYGRKNR